MVNNKYSISPLFLANMNYKCYNTNDKPIFVLKHYNCIGLIIKTKRDSCITILDSEYNYCIIVKEISRYKYKFIKIRVEENKITSKT
jgi:hypothetical protein